MLYAGPEKGWDIAGDLQNLQKKKVNRFDLVLRAKFHWGRLQNSKD